MIKLAAAIGPLMVYICFLKNIFFNSIEPALGLSFVLAGFVEINNLITAKYKCFFKKCMALSYYHLN